MKARGEEALYEWERRMDEWWYKGIVVPKVRNDPQEDKAWHLIASVTMGIL